MNQYLKQALSLILMICGAFTSASYAQDHLVTHRFIRDKVTEGYFQQKVGTTIPLDDYCINSTEAKVWLHLIENRLPAEPNRMPWWSELVPVPRVTPCNLYSDPACLADYESYGACGSWLYEPGFDVHFATFNRQRIGGTTNPLWNPSAYLGSLYCSTPPPTQQSGLMAAPAARAMLVGDSSTPAQVSTLASIWSGALNRCGVWACNNEVGTNVWMSVSGVFAAPVAKTYYIGVAADNLFELYVDGILIAAMNDGVLAPETSFLLWHILPVSLTAGSHTIEIKGRNTQPGPASIGCEVYDNTPAELGNAATIDDLNILFTTQSSQGGTICRDGPITNNFEMAFSNDTYETMEFEYGGITYVVPPYSNQIVTYIPGFNTVGLNVFSSSPYDLNVAVLVDSTPYDVFAIPPVINTTIGVVTTASYSFEIVVSN